jgi:hypothetical protein
MSVATTEAQRIDLYNGLVELLGEQRAGTLMAFLPTQMSGDLATKSDVLALEQRLDRRFDALDESLIAVNRRIDRLFRTLVAGLFVIVAAMAGVVFSGLG